MGKSGSMGAVSGWSMGVQQVVDADVSHSSLRTEEIRGAGLMKPHFITSIGFNTVLLKNLRLLPGAASLSVDVQL